MIMEIGVSQLMRLSAREDFIEVFACSFHSVHSKKQNNHLYFYEMQSTRKVLHVFYIQLSLARFQVLTAVFLIIQVFWDVLRCVAILLVSSSIEYQAVKGD